MKAGSTARRPGTRRVECWKRAVRSDDRRPALPTPSIANVMDRFSSRYRVYCSPPTRSPVLTPGDTVPVCAGAPHAEPQLEAIAPFHGIRQHVRRPARSRRLDRRRVELLAIDDQPPAISDAHFCQERRLFMLHSHFVRAGLHAQGRRSGRTACRPRRSAPARRCGRRTGPPPPRRARASPTTAGRRS